MSERPESPSGLRPPAPPDGEGRVHVVGTAHVSSDSVTEVEETIEAERPDVVAVELDEGRFRQMKGGAAEDIEPRDLLEGNTVFQFLAYWMLSYVQARMGDRFDIDPGADMMAAVDTAEELGIGVALVDRDIQVTIQRFWSRMTFIEKLKLIGGMFLGILGFGGGGDEEELDMEDLTDTDVVTALLEEFRRFSPGGAEALIDERDAYIAHKLVALRRQGYHVVAVVGAGHQAGIEGYLEDPDTLPPLADLVGTRKKRFSLFKLFGYLFTLGFAVFFLLLLLGGASNAFMLKLFAAWFLFNGIFAFSLAKVAGARWTSAGVGGAVAWLTSVNPLLAPGWFAGYMELRHQAVNVGDISTLNDILGDEESPIRDVLGRMYEVPLFRLIMVVAMTNVGSFVASALFPFVVLPWLAPEVGGVGGVVDLMWEGFYNGVDIVEGVLP